MHFIESQIEVITLSFGQLIQEETIIVDEYVQRRLSNLRKKAISTYILTALAKKNRGAYFAPIVASRREDGVLAILDGQHRYFGYLDAIHTLEEHVKKLQKSLFSRDMEDAPEDVDLEALKRQWENEQNALKGLYRGVFPVMVYKGLTVGQEQQMFHDLNSLARKVPTSLSLLYNHADLYSQIARELRHLDWMSNLVSVEKQSENSLFLFSTLVRSVEFFIGKGLTEENYDSKYEEAEAFFRMVVDTIPTEANSEAYLYRDAKSLQGIASFANKVQTEHPDDWFQIVQATLKGVPFLKSNMDFVEIGGAFTKDGSVVFPATGSGIKSVVQTLMSKMVMPDKKRESVQAEVAPSKESQTDQDKLDEAKAKIVAWISDNGGEVSAKRDEIPKLLGCSRTSTRLAILELADAGAIQIVSQPGKPNTYHLV